MVKATAQVHEEEALWAPGPVWKVMERRNLMTSPGFEPRTVQPVPSRYTDSAILAPYYI